MQTKQYPIAFQFVETGFRSQSKALPLVKRALRLNPHINKPTVNKTCVTSHRAGFRLQTEPYLRGMLQCIIASQLKDLRSKARIFVEKGGWCYGVMDETGTLQASERSEPRLLLHRSSHIDNCYDGYGRWFFDREG